MIFEWMSDPAAWAGLMTLILLEIVLGIDNLVFIAILADRLPERQRDKARMIGLSLALIMRLLLLVSISWIVTLTAPIFSIMGLEISGRDLILIGGGLFLLFKGTMELHERLEGHTQKESKIRHAVFWQVIVQIVVLDAVFSLDSVITAVGMVDHLSVMMIAVIIAVGVMMISSKPLMAFVSKHPTVVILCLGFLMMIGFSLIVEGFDYHVPKGYLYAAIGFSIVIEALNQISKRNRERELTTGNLRARAADAVLGLLGGKPTATMLGEGAGAIAERAAQGNLFAREETDMIRGVLSLAERSAVSVMTHRTEIDWLDIETPQENMRERILALGHSRLPLARGSLDEFIGVALAKDLLHDLLEEGTINLERSLRQPLVVHESLNVLRLMEALRRAPVQMAMIMDEYGSLQGIVTPTDILEAIAGEFPDEGEDQEMEAVQEGDAWLFDGGIDIRRLSPLLDVDLTDEAGRYSTLAGYLLWQFEAFPTEQQILHKDGLIFEIVEMEERNIRKVRVRAESNDT